MTLNLQDTQVRSLIAPFTDVASELKVTSESDTAVRVEGRRRFRPFTLVIQHDPEGQLVVASPKGVLTPLASVLSGPQFADLDALARSMIHFLKATLGKADQVVDSLLLRDDDPPILASQALARALVPGGMTRLTFLHGHAGSGKSWMLMKAALSQTHQFLTRQARRVDLYVDAQGVNLRSLEQQIARQLDIYNGILRFPEVVPLARLGVLGLIVDGFDELITPSGSSDTLRALYRYLADFQGDGTILASARTSYFYLRDLESAHITPDTPVSVEILGVSPWDATQWREYCELHERPDTYNTIRDLAAASHLNRTLLGRAFIVSEILKIASQNSGRVGSSSLLTVIEDSFIERERTLKLVDPDSVDPDTTAPRPILSRQQFDGLVLEVAEEMWRLRQNSLDSDTLKTLASLWSEESRLPRDYRDILIDRIDASAFLEPVFGGAAERRVQFPHEVIFARALARLFLRVMARGERDLISHLRVAPISVTVAEQIADIASTSSGGGIAALARQLSNTSQLLRWRADDDANPRASLASIVTELLRVSDRDLGPIEFSHLYFYKVEFSAARLAAMTLRNCTFDDIDARGANWSHVQFVECDPIGKLTVSRGQKFHGSLPDVHHLTVYNPNGTQEDVFGRSPCRRALFGEPPKSLAAPPRTVSTRAEEIISITEALARRAQRTFWFTEKQEDWDDGFFARLKGSARWEETLQLLRDYGFLESSVRSRAGVQARLSHLKDASELLKNREPTERRPGSAAARYWDLVERLA